MFNIALCEDNAADRRRIHELLEKFFGTAGTNYSLEDFSSGASFLKKMKPYQYHLVIFDIEMHGINGIETAKSLRNADRSVMIVFTTAYTSYVFSSFDAEPLQYLLKPMQERSFDELMQNVAARVMERQHLDYTISFNGVLCSVPIPRIMYFESKGRCVDAVAGETRYSFYAKLNEVGKDERLQNFIRCHQSFLINPEYISRISRDSVLLTNGSRIIISRSKAAVVKSNYMFYLGKMEL